MHIDTRSSSVGLFCMQQNINRRHKVLHGCGCDCGVAVHSLRAATLFVQQASEQPAAPPHHHRSADELVVGDLQGEGSDRGEVAAVCGGPPSGSTGNCGGEFPAVSVELQAPNEKNQFHLPGCLLQDGSWSLCERQNRCFLSPSLFLRL